MVRMGDIPIDNLEMLSAICTTGMIGQWHPYMTGNGQYARFWYHRL